MLWLQPGRWHASKVATAFMAASWLPLTMPFGRGDYNARKEAFSPIVCL
jgi:hypothetical protein